MRTILLLRAFGDFVIPLFVFRHVKNNESVKFIASKHHRVLYEALPKNLLPQNISISFADFGISKTLFRVFTNKYFFNYKTLQEILLLKKTTKSLCEKTLYLEQNKKSSLLGFLVGSKFKSVVQNQNIYSAYAAFFNVSLSQNIFSINQAIANKKILILPSTRQKRKNFPQELLQKIVALLANKTSEIQIIFYKNIPEKFVGNAKVYNSFGELIEQLQSADFAICGDSLPVHLAQFLNKPHFVFYNSEGPTQFITPFALENNCYANFNEVNKFKTICS